MGGQKLRLPREVVKSPFLNNTQKLTGYRPEQPDLSRDFGLSDIQRWLPSIKILWFCEKKMS